MKGRTPSKAEKAHMDRVQQLGCLACLVMGYAGTPACIHHTDGKTKPGAHFLTLPLCPGHHNQDERQYGKYAIHLHPKDFRENYGTEEELLAQVAGMLE